MAVKFTNNAATTLTADVAALATSVSVASSASFPDISTSGYFYITLGTEVIKVTAVNTTTHVLTVDATVGSYTNGDGVELRMSAEVLEDVRTETTYTAGTNVTLTGNAFSSTNTTYTAGTGVGIDGSNEITVTSLALTTVQTAASEAAQLALTTQEGDAVVRSDENKSYIHNGGTSGTIADFTLLATPDISISLLTDATVPQANSIGIGTDALSSSTSGYNNVALGRDALTRVTTGAGNIGLGYTAGTAITTGSNNTIIGAYWGTNTLASTAVIMCGSTERLLIDSTGLKINGATVETNGITTGKAIAMAMVFG